MVREYDNALRSLWHGVCTVYVTRHVLNPANGRNEARDVMTAENEPCRLSRRMSARTVSGTKKDNETAAVYQTVKLFIDKDVEVPPGARLVVTQNGYTAEYERAGAPVVYERHQEIVLERKKARA
ncbi:MAG: hypothetical protein IKD89_07735 [Clostridia bacterium]|nr:hypothetical protein [Clostridia bacterium]